MRDYLDVSDIVIYKFNFLKFNSNQKLYRDFEWKVSHVSYFYLSTLKLKKCNYTIFWNRRIYIN